MELTVQQRTIFGKKVKALRKQGLIPAELYGHGQQNIHLSVLDKDFNKVFKQAGESATIDLMIGKDRSKVLIHDVIRNHLTDEISHIDFYAVKMDEKIKIKVPLLFMGEAPAVKEKGGALVKSGHEIEIEALPADLPHHIEVNLVGLEEIGSSITVKDLRVSDKVKILIDPHTVVASVVELAKEEEAPAPAMKVEDIKVEGEEKKKEREEKKEKGEGEKK